MLEENGENTLSCGKERLAPFFCFFAPFPSRNKATMCKCIGHAHEYF